MAGWTQRFMTKVSVDPETGCWMWTAGTTDGYGAFWLDGRTRQAHRVSYERFLGPIPAGLTLDHLISLGCRGRACVNPEHLEPVTVSENLRRRDLPRGTATFNGSKTHCPHGHPYSEANTIRRPDGRVCRACRRAYQRRYRALRKVAS